MKRRSLGESIFWYVLASIWTLVALFPIWVLFSGTFSKNTDDVTQTYFPDSFSNGITKVKEALSTINIGQATIDTFIYTTVTIVGLLIICSLAAYEFSFFKFPGRNALFSLVMVSMMMPMILYVIPLYRMVYKMGLSDTVLGVSLPLMVSALSVFIMMQFLEDLPLSIIESARIDGAGHFRIFGEIVLPLMRNGILTTTVLMFMKTWGQYLWPSLVTAQKIRPISVVIANMLAPNFWVDGRVKLASMLLAMIPPMLIYLVFQRYVIEGVTMSSVKG
jgi:multiple sugar transport system permease protein